MGKLKITVLAMLAILVFSNAAFAKTYTINFRGSATTPGIWGVELSLLTSNFIFTSATPGAAVPGDWTVSSNTTVIGGEPVYRVTLNQDLISNPNSYLGDGQMLTIEYTGNILGVHASSIIYEDVIVGEDYKDGYLHPFRPWARSSSGFTLMPPVLAPMHSLILP